MGLLDKLWDDTIGGPQPEKGVGILRKLEIPTSPRSSLDYGDSPYGGTPPDGPPVTLLDRRMSGDFVRGTEGERKIARSIAIVKPKKVERSTSLPADFFGIPNSPSVGSTGFGSPGKWRDENMWRSVFHSPSNKSPSSPMERTPGSLGSAKFEKGVEGKGPVYDWYNRLD